jgi:two-component system, cell cycle response regulator
MSVLRKGRRDEFVPLSERVLMLMAFRVAAGVAIGLITQVTRPAPDLGQQWLVIGGYLLATGLLSLPALTAQRSLTLRTFSINLLLDGAFLQGEQALGPRSDSLVILVAAYLAVVCLLASFRTGIKVAVWQGLLVFMLHEAAVTRSLSGLAPWLGDQTAMLTQLGAIWLTVVVVAQFAALNERELRRRRYDAESLYELAATLVTTEAVAQVRSAVLDFCCAELGASRAAWVTRLGDRYVLGTGQGLTLDAEPVEPGTSELLASHRTAARVVHELGVDDAWLAGLFPGGRRLVAVPIPHAPTGDWVVFEHLGRGTRLERRIVNTAMQACAAAALACSRATVIGRLRVDASTDALTRCANRGLFDGTLARIRASSDLPVSLMLIDIDHFKQVNDVHGHQTGDDVLRSVGENLAVVARDSDLVARYGGEEFAIVMLRTSASEAREVAERVRRHVGAHTEPVPVTVSIGVATATALPLDRERLIGRADEALYAAKAAGRNQVVEAVDGGVVMVSGPVPTVPTDGPVPPAPPAGPPSGRSRPSPHPSGLSGRIRHIPDPAKRR